uniref:hypothetical protein n=1 Tax=uncultured Ruminococcus sp. TaxID=165186 RepID=UPI0025EF89A3|nr:hypothetical protein [uncultured Ruminococcus sp.]
MSEIKITIDVPQLSGVITALEHLANAMGGPNITTVAITEPQTVEAKTDTAKGETKTPTLTDESTDKQYTLEEVRAVFMKCAKKHGKEEVKKILADLGVAKVTEIKEEDFAKAVKAVEEVK